MNENKKIQIEKETTAGVDDRNGMKITITTEMIAKIIKIMTPDRNKDCVWLVLATTKKGWLWKAIDTK